MKGKPYDAASKALLELDPVGWAAFVGVVRPPALAGGPIDADKVSRMHEPFSWVL